MRVRPLLLRMLAAPAIDDIRRGSRQVISALAVGLRLPFVFRHVMPKALDLSFRSKVCRQ
jgi:hypothetical protein